MWNLQGALEHVLDAVIPPRQRSSRTKARQAADIPLSPTEHELLGARIITLMNYRQQEAQDLIRALKYDGSRHAAALAAELLAEYLREEIAAARTFSQRPILLVPLPLHQSRRRERGFNQIELVLRALPEDMQGGPLARLEPRALARVRATPPQTKLKRAERIKNVQGAFAADHARAAGTRIYLIDDVTTTGATLLEASKPLTAAGAEVMLLALARA